MTLLSPILLPAPITSQVEAPVVPTITVTRNIALRIMDEAVQARGEDFVQMACQYSIASTTDDDGTVTSREPACIVGYVLYLLLGEALFTHVLDKVVDNDAGWGRIYGDIPGVEFTPNAVRVLNTAQMLQDGRAGDSKRYPWGEARRMASALAAPVDGLDNDADW